MAESASEDHGIKRGLGLAVAALRSCAVDVAAAVAELFEQQGHNDPLHGRENEREDAWQLAVRLRVLSSVHGEQLRAAIAGEAEVQPPFWEAQSELWATMLSRQQAALLSLLRRRLDELAAAHHQ
ncbi:unnamed protein product, partial [Phaeothamnion confervicola]